MTHIRASATLAVRRQVLDFDHRRGVRNDEMDSRYASVIKKGNSVAEKR